MILVQDNCFETETFKSIQDYCNNNEFQKVETEGKDFFVLETPRELIPLLQFVGYELILTFIRVSDKDRDVKLNIHCDGYIQNSKTALASVLYISDDNEVSETGTSFFEHKSLGIKAPSDLSEQEFNRLLIEDSGDISKWKEKDHISARPNRMLTYDSNMFHAKMPHKTTIGKRIILVAFFKKL